MKTIKRTYSPNPIFLSTQGEPLLLLSITSRDLKKCVKGMLLT